MRIDQTRSSYAPASNASASKAVAASAPVVPSRRQISDYRVEDKVKRGGLDLPFLVAGNSL